MTLDDKDTVALTGKDLACRYGSTRVLDHVDIKLRRGSISVVLGPSGAGKSTLLRAIAGFEPLVSGSIEAGERLLSDASFTLPPERRQVGIVVQDIALFPHLTALQNIAFGLTGSGKAKIAQEKLRLVGLSDRAAAYPHELSGGEQQRVALARALAPDPAVLLLDEAFSSLDPQLRRSLRHETEAILRDSGAAILMVTHDPEEAMEMADELVVMTDGRVMQTGTPENVYWHPANHAAAKLLGEVNLFTGQCMGDGMHTPFGRIACPDDCDGKQVEALVRPETIELQTSNQGDAAKVTSSRCLGGQTRVEISSQDGSEAVALINGTETFPIGSSVQLVFDPQRIAFC